MPTYGCVTLLRVDLPAVPVADGPRLLTAPAPPAVPGAPVLL